MPIILPVCECNVPYDTLSSTVQVMCYAILTLIKMVT